LREDGVRKWRGWLIWKGARKGGVKRKGNSKGGREERLHVNLHVFRIYTCIKS